MADYQILNNKRARIKGSLTRISNMSLNDETTVDEIQTRIEKLDELWSEFHEVEDEMSVFEEFKTSVEKFEIDYFNIKSKLRFSERKLKEFRTRVANLTSIEALAEQQKSFIEEVSEINKHTHDIHLPKLKLDPFYGNYKEWPTFKDMYMAAIHNTQLSDAQKLQHLKNLLKGAAATTLKNTRVTDANYSEAWEKVLNRYDRKRYIIYSYIHEFCNIRAMLKPNTIQLRAITDSADENIRGLQALGADAESRDHFLIYIVLQKLDIDTRDAWARKFTDTRNLPSWESFIEFLENRCDAFENSVATNQAISYTRQSSISIKNHVSTTSDTVCVKCDGDHRIHDCSEFKSLTGFQRKQFVYSNNLCIWCLRHGHTARTCQNQRQCFICKKNGQDGKHHSLLHYSNSSYGNNSNTIVRASVANLSPNGDNFCSSVTTNQENELNRNSTNEVIFATTQPVLRNEINGHQKAEPLRSNTFNTMLPLNSQKPNISSAVLSAVATDPMNVLLNQCSAVLPTALIQVKDRFGTLHMCRALLDSGSQTNFISEACVQRLQLKRVHIQIQIDGIASSAAGTTNGMVHLKLANRFNDSIICESSALILSRLTSTMPSLAFSVKNWSYLNNVTLADPQFNIPGSIDIIIGAPKFFEVLLDGKIFDNNRKPCAHNTVFGYVIAGQMPNIEVNQNENITSCTVQLDLSNLLCKFWEIEEIPFKKATMSTNDVECENHFRRTYDRDHTGRFVLRLPFKSNSSAFCNSQQQAITRLYAMERRFKVNKQLQNDYITFMREYESLGHMEKIKPNEIQIKSSSCFYLPHHAVIKQSTTTKTRAVFDGSARSSNGVTLNDVLMVGPVVQPSMIEILLKFRLHLIAFSSDIQKMYRQMLIHSNDTNFQRIVWRESESEPIHHYKLKTVTYGLSCAPYQATRSLKQIAMDCKNKQPRISKVIEEQCYVDDLLSGVDCINDAIYIYENLINVFEAYGLCLRKWKSNSNEFFSLIPKDHQEISHRDLDKDNPITKILGLQWNASEDALQYKYSPIDTTNKVTKRTILSEVSRLFDPIGLISPVVIKFKMLLQALWIEKSDWDNPIPTNLLTIWNETKDQLCEVEKFKIPRCIKIKDAVKYQLIGFSDASEKAYGAAVYLKSIDKDDISKIRLVISKSRVAPLKVTSIPRLELNAAVLLSRLLIFVKDVLKIDKIELFAYSDSTTVLSWLALEPYKLKTYVANRTEEIISLIPPQRWRYTKSQENPADYVSRGVTTKELLNLNIWWNGPEWLQNSSTEWPNSHVPCNHLNVEKEIRKRVKVLLANTNGQFFNQICSKFSSFNKLINFIAAWCRIMKFLKQKQTFATTFTARELIEAEKICIKKCQMLTFSQEINELMQGKPVHNKSKILSLHPFIDSDDLLRVGGRLARSTLSFDQKHPLLLPQGHTFSKLLMLHYHIKYLHAGPTLLTSIVRRKFWIIRCRDVAKLIVNRCLTCFKYKQNTAQQLMGNVPKPRVEPQVRPFIHTGLDYAGPINLKMCKGRSKITYKAYIVVYVCLTTKALTIDLVTELSSEAFIASLKRFISRRGIPLHLYSDNSSTFVGANKKLGQMFKLRQSFNPILSYLSGEAITFHFIPPLSPHIGGMWEASVRSIKFHLKRVLKDQLLSYEELITFLLQVELVLNSRPLCRLSQQPEEFEVLTPAHFLIGEAYTNIPEESLESTPMNRLSRFQRITKMKQSFWRHWHKAYLNSLQHRPKWKRQEPNMKAGDLVVVKEDGVPPSAWIIAQVIKCYPGEDNNVRVVSIKTSKGTYKRSITKLVKLPSPDDDEEKIVKGSLNGGENV